MSTSVNAFNLKDAMKSIGNKLAQFNTHSLGEHKSHSDITCLFDPLTKVKHSVFINCPNGHKYEIPVCPQMTIMNLKEAIEDKEGANYIKQFQ